MLKKIILFLFLLINSSFSLAGGLSFRGPFWQDFDNVNQREKTLVYLPENYDKNKKYPLIISLHGLGASASLQNLIFDFRELTTEFQFILAVPNGLQGAAGLRFWNGTDFCCGENQKPVDDVQYVRDLIEGMAQEYSIDKNRIHLFGHSNGGFLSHRIACEAPELIASMASFAGATFKDPEKCEGREAVPVLQIHGTSDLIIQYNGSPGYPSARETVRQWTKINKCLMDKVVKKENQILKPRNMTVPTLNTTEETWESCDKGTKVALWTVDKGEHLTEPNKEYLVRVIKFLFQFSKK
jgi:polyhydroxybutyrate depolymerase